MIEVDISKLKEHPFSKEVFEDLSREEYEAVKADIQRNGIKVPLDVLPDYTVLDGHQRRRIAIELGLEKVPCEIRHLKNEAEIKEYIIFMNLLRRQLTAKQKALAIAKLSKIYEVGRGKYGRGRPKLEEAKFASPDVIEKTAQKTGIKPRTVILYRTYARAIEEFPELGGLDSVNSVVIEYQRRKKIESRKRMLKKAPELKNLILGDAFEKIDEIPDNSIDLLLTDPPYGTGYRPYRGETEQLRGKEWAKIVGDEEAFFEKFDEFLQKLKLILSGMRSPRLAFLNLEKIGGMSCKCAN